MATQKWYQYIDYNSGARVQQIKFIRDLITVSRYGIYVCTYAQHSKRNYLFKQFIGCGPLNAITARTVLFPRSGQYTINIIILALWSRAITSSIFFMDTNFKQNNEHRT